MQTAKDRNLTVRLPVDILRKLKQQSASEGVSMNAYLEGLLAKTLDATRNDAKRMAAARLLERAKEGIYSLKQPLSREEAHDRRG
ncbi:MAG: hypothetical protein ACRD34_01810 [Bryobacteraceae bacterium]